MEELLTKYGVNLNDYSGEYDIVVFRCKRCIEDLKRYNPYIYKNGKTIPLTKIKAITVADGDCENANILPRVRSILLHDMD